MIRTLCQTSIALLAVTASNSAAQDPQEFAAARRAVATWLGSEHTDAKVLDTAVEAVLDGGRPAFVMVEKELDRSTDRHRRAAVQSLITRVALGFLNRQGKSGLVYAGQYDPLAPLMPHVGRFYLNLVLDTPDWFPDNQRAAVVPTLRDLYPKGPDEDALEALEEIAEDEDFESEQLRISLGYALYQWGKRDLVSEQIRELEESAGDGKTADGLFFVRHLAHVYYQVRDYDTAAKTWLRFLRNTEALDDRPSALDYYNAGCSLSLAGRIADALAELERCSARVAKGPHDSSVELSRAMFETDPDLRAVRSTKRFVALVKAAFGATDTGDKEDKRLR